MFKLLIFATTYSVMIISFNKQQYQLCLFIQLSKFNIFLHRRIALVDQTKLKRERGETMYWT